MPDITPAMAARIASSFADQSLMQTFDARIDRVAPGHVTISAPIGPHVRQQHGYAHAGLTFSLGDTAAGYAALTLMQPDSNVLTVEMKINLIAPAAGDRLIAEGRVVRAGRRLSVVQADVFVEADGVRRQVALLQGTMIPA